MDISPQGLVRAFAYRVPALTVNTCLAALGLSRNSSDQDFLTELITLWARPVLRTPAALLKSQQAFNYDYGVWGRMWISKWTIPVEDSLGRKTTDGGVDEHILTLQEAIASAIIELGDQDLRPIDLTMPVLDPVQTEWTGYRRNVSHVAMRPSLSERDMYAAMMADLPDTCGPTILYFHGGAHCLMDPTTHRWTTSALAQKSGGRVLSVRYRLAPQHVFPAALLDALAAYLALIAPPLGAFHEAVPPEKIVLAGDSSGGGLASSLLLLLQTLSRRQGEGKKRRIVFQGQAVTIPDLVCAGLALSSPWLDITRCLPSTTANARWDIIAPPPPRNQNPTPAFPTDAIWPASPPRVETYCTARMCIHPLVSPLAAQPRHWRGVPPVYVCVGWEGMQDEAEVFARRVFQSADPGNQAVVFDGWEGMPHCFAMFAWNGAGRKAMQNWAGFCREVVVDPTRFRKRGQMGTWTNGKTGVVKEVSLGELGVSSGVGCWYERERLDDRTVDAKLQDGQRWRVELDDEMVRQWQAERKGASHNDTVESLKTSMIPGDTSVSLPYAGVGSLLYRCFTWPTRLGIAGTGN
ncbi:hypothetical protein LTR84_013066 [Exophiala bonariae]|uniref:Alpha/beta hydrolase fold-3 domain-containing protein n=1 Tax=Exophiala bonariae TaxID=1690606 RepID=A0AAV9NI77_9EURO|nr:hypothetical protein LTR84_013066 [Exophiala bonariae]